MATSYLGKLWLLRMIGTGDKDQIITKVVPGNAPLQDCNENYPNNLIVLDYETDEAEDLLKILMTSEGGITKDKLHGLLGDFAAAHTKVASSIDALEARVHNMTVEQAEEVNGP